MNVLDVIYKLAMIGIAVANIGFAVYIYITNHRRDMTKTLVLEHIIPDFYIFFNALNKELNRLIDNNKISMADKKEMQTNIRKIERTFEQQFIDIFLCIDKEMHMELKKKIDILMDQITEALFDEGINLYIENKYNEKIGNNVILAKADILKFILEHSK